MAAAPVPGADAGVDTSGSRNNWSAISASHLRPQMRAPLQQSKAGIGGTHTYTRQAVAQSLGCWSHVGRLCESPSAASETNQSDFIVGTTEGGRKRQAKKNISLGQRPRARAYQQILRDPATSPSYILQIPAVMQGERGGGEGGIPPGTKYPTAPCLYQGGYLEWSGGGVVRGSPASRDGWWSSLLLAEQLEGYVETVPKG